MAHPSFLGDGEPAPTLPEWLNKKTALVVATAALAVYAGIQFCNVLGMLAGAQTGGINP